MHSQKRSPDVSRPETYDSSEDDKANILSSASQTLIPVLQMTEDQEISTPNLGYSIKLDAELLEKSHPENIITQLLEEEDDSCVMFIGQTPPIELDDEIEESKKYL